MKVYFIGAGPGASDLITVRGANILARTPLILYAGSLVSRDILAYASSDAQVVNTANLNLDEQEAYYRDASEQNRDVARIHSGDPGIYGALAEQMRRLDELGIAYETVPGVSSFTAAAAQIQSELTKPEVSQTIILTRTSGRASAVPTKESLTSLAKHRSTLCVFLSGGNLRSVVDELATSYPPETPVALVRSVSWPEETCHRSTLGNLLNEIEPSQWRLTTLLLIGDVLTTERAPESKLYSRDYAHRYRKASREAI